VTLETRLPLDALPAGATPHGVTAAPERVDGRACLRVELTDEITRSGVPGVDYIDRPTFVLLPVEFRTGTIDVSVWSHLNGKTDFPARGFAGLAFHVADDLGTFSSAYLRPLNGSGLNPPPPRQLRAVQYFTFPEWPFDRLRESFPDGRYEATADIAPARWITLHVEVGDERLRVVVDGSEVLVVDAPLAPARRGRVGLFVDIGTEAFFADLVVRDDGATAPVG
jgi:hypothetical protein